MSALTPNDRKRLERKAQADPDVALLLAEIDRIRRRKPSASKVTRLDPELARRYQAGESVKELASEAGVDRVTFYKFLRLAGVELHVDKRKPIPSELLEQYRTGAIPSILALAKAAGTNERNARLSVLEAGITKELPPAANRKTNPHIDEMRELRRQGLSLREIAQRFGLTKERVRQLTFGIKPERPDGTTMSELATLLDSSPLYLGRVLRELGIPPRGKRYALTPDEVERVRRHVTKACVICGKVLAVRHSKLCGAKACQTQWQYRQQATVLERGGTSLPVQVAAVLKGVPKGHKWVGIREAEELSGLPKFDLYYLTNTKAVATRPSGRTLFGGMKRERLFSAAQMVAIRRGLESGEIVRRRS